MNANEVQKGVEPTPAMSEMLATLEPGQIVGRGNSPKGRRDRATILGLYRRGLVTLEPLGTRGEHGWQAWVK